MNRSGRRGGEGAGPRTSPILEEGADSFPMTQPLPPNTRGHGTISKSLMGTLVSCEDHHLWMCVFVVPMAGQRGASDVTTSANPPTNRSTLQGKVRVRYAERSLATTYGWCPQVAV